MPRRYLLIVGGVILYALIGFSFFISHQIMRPVICQTSNFNSGEPDLTSCTKQPIISLDEIPSAIYTIAGWPLILLKV